MTIDYLSHVIISRTRKLYHLILLFCVIFASMLNGQTSGSVLFDGVNDYVSIGTHSVHQITTNLTLEALIYPTSNNIYAGIINNVWDNGPSLRSGFGLLLGGTDGGYQRVYFVITTSSGIKYLDGELGALNGWNHIAGTYDGSIMRLYVNGVLASSFLKTDPIIYSPSNELRIGKYYDSNEQYFYKGYIDQVRVWDIVRSQNEIQDNRFSELSGSESGLIGYWKFNEGSGTITEDETSNDKDGTLFNGVAWSSETALPVELTSFTVATIGNTNELIWKTAMEMNNYGFEIEKRRIQNTVDSSQKKAEQWSTIGFIDGGGTTNTPKEYSFTDKNLSPGKYSYRLKQIDRDGKFEYSQAVEVMVNNVPNVFALKQNYPNPFNPSTRIQYSLGHSGVVSLEIYNVLGLHVRTLTNEFQPIGNYGVEWNGKDDANRSVASGVYFYKIAVVSNGEKIFHSVKKMILMK